MKIITVDNKEFDIKYYQNRESVSNDFGTAALDYPDFIGSKLYQNSSSSDKYSLSFTIHVTNYVSFKESFKKFITNYEDAITHPIYGKLTHCILVHDKWGAIKGSVIGGSTYDTSKEADIPVNCIFQEHTEDDPIEKRDIEIENLEAFNSIDAETSANFKVNLSSQDVSAITNFTNSLNSLYNNIKDSAVVSSINDMKSALNTALLDSQKLMNAVKKVLSLPNELLSFNLANRFELLKKQATAIKAIPVTSYNMALFNINSLAYNTGATSRTAFVSEAALAAAAGLKTVPI